MNRKEEINKSIPDVCSDTEAVYYVWGAEWADKHPRNDLVDINSVCGWIITHINDYLIEGSILGTPCSTIDTDDLVKELHKAFKL